MPTLNQARSVAEEFVEHLRPACVRIDIAGSIRRGKPRPKDVEIVYQPAPASCVVDLFGTTSEYDLTPDRIYQLLDAGTYVKDTKVKRWGLKHKRMVHVATKTVIELFAARPENYGLILALRTGPADFNKVLVSSMAIGGAMPFHMRMRDGDLWHTGARLPTPDEETFFAELDLPCWPPEQRTVARLRTYLQEETGP